MVVYTREGEKVTERQTKKGRGRERGERGAERYKWVMSRIKRNSQFQ